MRRVSSYIQRLLLFKPTYLWCMNRWKTQASELLELTLRTPYLLLYKKEIAIAIPSASPESAFGTKGGGQPSPWSSPLSPQCILINRFPRCCNPAGLLSILTLPKGNKDLSILANDNEAFFFPQKLADNGEMVSITSFTYHLSNSLSELDIIASTWNCYSMTKFLSIKPPVGVLSPLYLPRAVEPFLGWMPEHVRFYLICLLGGSGGWSSEVQLGESISVIVPSLLLLFEILLNQLNQYLFLLLILFFKTFQRNVGYSSQCETT
jgi:hypothetical protein